MAKSGSSGAQKAPQGVTYPTGDLPYGLSLPDESLIIPTASGKYNVTLEIVCLDAPDKMVCFVAPLVDGNQQTGTIKLSRDTLYTFREVSPQPGKALKLGFRNLRKTGNDIEFELQPSLFTAKPVKQSAQASVRVITSPVGKKQKVHTVRVYKLDKNGESQPGNVEITAGQNFEVDGTLVSGHHVVDIPDKFGVSLQIKPLLSDEGFKFTDLETGQSVKKVLLCIK